MLDRTQSCTGPRPPDRADPGPRNRTGRDVGTSWPSCQVDVAAQGGRKRPCPQSFALTLTSRPSVPSPVDPETSGLASGSAWSTSGKHPTLSCRHDDGAVAAAPAYASSDTGMRGAFLLLAARKHSYAVIDGGRQSPRRRRGGVFILRSRHLRTWTRRRFSRVLTAAAACWWVACSERRNSDSSEEIAERVGWVLLNRLDLGTGEMPDKLRALDGGMIRIAGYVVPIEDHMTRASEFLLAPYSGACIHTPPPPPDQILQVVMEADPVRFQMDRCYWLEGRLRISDSESPYGRVAYRLEGKSLTPYASAD